MYKKIIIIVLLLSLTITNIFLPIKKVDASGLPVGIALYEFIMLALATGVTFNAVEEAEMVLSDFEKNNPRPPILPNGAIVSAMLGIGIAEHKDDINSFLTDIKDYFKTTKNDKGELDLSDSQLAIPGESLRHGQVYYFNISSNEILNFMIDSNDSGLLKLNIFRDDLLIRDYTIDKFIVANNVTYNYHHSEITTAYGNIIRIDNCYGDNSQYKINTRYNTILDDSRFGISRTVPINVKSNSYLDTDVLPSQLPNPNLSNVPVTDNVNDNGTKTTNYTGTTEDLITDIVNNLDLNNLTNQNPYIVDIDDETGLIILPEDNPNPYPNPDPELNPENADGTKISLLQQIVNWCKRIWEKIPDGSSTPDAPSSDSALDFSPLMNIPVKEVFPFCIPFDIVDTFKLFLGTDRSPPVFHLELPFDIPLDFDLSNFGVLALMGRSIFYILFIIGLMKVTTSIPSIS